MQVARYGVTARYADFTNFSYEGGYREEVSENDVTGRNAVTASRGCVANVEDSRGDLRTR